MKAETTIRREIARLRKLAHDEAQPAHTQREAYEAYHALRWAIGCVHWTPSRVIKDAGETKEDNK